MRSSTSRARAEACRILRRIAARAGDAESAISSSDRMAPQMRFSRYWFGVRRLNRSSRLVRTPSHFCFHSVMPRRVRRTPAIFSSSAIFSRPPACALRSGPATSVRPPNDGEPNRAIRTNASSVSCSRRSASSGDGSSCSAACAAASHDVCSASSFKILSSSSARQCLFKYSCIMKTPLSQGLGRARSARQSVMETTSGGLLTRGPLPRPRLTSMLRPPKR